MLQSRPVRPPHLPGEEANTEAFDPGLCRPCVDVGEDEDVNFDLADLDDPIVGVEHVLSDKDGAGALEAQPLSSPPSMTPAAFARHCLTHLPYHSGCPICVASKRPNAAHFKSHESSRTIPLLVGDYGFIRSSLDEKTQMQNVLVLRVLPYKLNFETIAPVKGLDQPTAVRVARFIREAGLVHFAYRSDQESSLGSLLEEAIRLPGRTGVWTDTDIPAHSFEFPVPPLEDDEPDAPTQVRCRDAPEGGVVAVPELTHPGESQSNGLAERTVETVVDHIRTIITALEAHLKVHIPADHPVMA